MSVDESYKVDQIFDVGILCSASVQTVKENLDSSHFVLLEVELDFFSGLPVRCPLDQHAQNRYKAVGDVLFGPNEAIRANILKCNFMKDINHKYDK